MPRSRLTSQYSVTHSLFHHDYDITSDGKPLYHVDNSQLIPGKPDLTFHTTDAKGPIAGVVKYRHFSSDIIIGLGDPAHPHRTSWEHFTRDSPLATQYSFRVKIAGRRPRVFTWRYIATGISGHQNQNSGDGSSSSSSPASRSTSRSRSSSSSSSSRPSSRSSWESGSSSTSAAPEQSRLELVEESSQELVAEFSSGVAFSKKAGQFNIYKGYGRQFDLLALLTGLALREKLRRKSHAQ